MDVSVVFLFDSETGDLTCLKHLANLKENKLDVTTEKSTIIK
jgi:hypothetical protein